MLLNGIRVVEWSELLPAAFCTRILADLGAEVLKLERPGAGDPLRRQGPFLPGSVYGEDGALFAYLNHGKRSITLDPAVPSGLELLRRLLEQTTILVESQPQALVQGLGLAPPEVWTISPALVVLSATAFGRDDDRAATDLTLAHHAAFACHQARPVQSPERQPPVGGADREMSLAAGVSAAIAALWGILGAEQTGRGRHIDFAQADFITHLLIEPLADYGRGERRFSRLRENLHGTEVAGGLIMLLPCLDGFVMISPREQHQWDRWIELIGSPPWARDPALCGDRDTRTTNWPVLQEKMSEWTGSRTRQEVFAGAQGVHVACFPVAMPRDLLENPQLAARDFFDQLPLAAGGSLPMPGLPFGLETSAGATLPRARRVAIPVLGEANAEVLGERLGLSALALEALRRHGVV
jgi:benzylsuccinate CoA-transferase BbsE subunit